MGTNVDISKLNSRKGISKPTGMQEKENRERTEGTNRKQQRQ